MISKNVNIIMFVIFSSYTLFVTSGYLYSIILNNPYIFPISYLFFFIVSFRYKLPREYSRLVTISLLFFIFYVILLFLGSSFKNTGITFDDNFVRFIIKFFICIVLIPYLVFKYSNVIGLNTIVNNLKYLGVIAVIFQIYQWVNLDQFATVFNVEGEHFRASSFWSNSNITALFYLALMVIISKTHNRANGKEIIFFITIYSIGIFLTISRTAIISLFLLFFIYFFSVRGEFVKKILVTTLALLLLVYSFKYIENIPQFNRLTKLSDQFSETFDDSRMFLWSYTINYIIDNIGVLGDGFYSMNRIVPKGNGLGPHNMFLYVWGETGIIGLLMFLVYIYHIIFKKRSYVNSSRKTKRDNFFYYGVIMIFGLALMTNHHLLRLPTFSFVVALIVLIKKNNTIQL